MKTINAVIGTVLLIIGIIGLLAGLAVGSGTCSNSNLGAALLHIPTCSTVAVITLGGLLVGIIFVVAGAIILVRGRQKIAPQVIPVPTPSFAPQSLGLVPVVNPQPVPSAQINPSSSPASTPIPSSGASPPQSEGIRYCGKCGARNPKDGAFCVVCGKPLAPL